jgi:galactokinase
MSIERQVVGDYVRAMAWVLREHGIGNGFDVRIESQVPLGSGLSSSAALLIAVGRALRTAFDLTLDDLQLARLARKAETDFVGAPVGIMDQMACSLADTSAALFIDTRTLAHEKVPLPAGAEHLVIDSGVRHSHASGEYRVRRDECHRAAALLGGSLARRRRARSQCDRFAAGAIEPARARGNQNARLLARSSPETGDLKGVGCCCRVARFNARFEISVLPSMRWLSPRDCEGCLRRASRWRIGGAIGAHRARRAFERKSLPNTTSAIASRGVVT